jgi:penicillin-binding protein 1C
VIDKLTYEISVTEELPVKPIPLPDIAYHLTEKLAKSNKGENIKTTIDICYRKK